MLTRAMDATGAASYWGCTRTENLGEGIALGCGRAKTIPMPVLLRRCRNGARMRSSTMPGKRPRSECKQHNRRRKRAIFSQTRHGVRQTRQTGFNCINQQACHRSGAACRTYPYDPNSPVQHPCAASDCNCGATLKRACMCIHIFSIEFAYRRGRWRRPCVECAFYSYTRPGS